MDLRCGLASWAVCALMGACSADRGFASLEEAVLAGELPQAGASWDDAWADVQSAPLKPGALSGDTGLAAPPSDTGILGGSSPGCMVTQTIDDMPSVSFQIAEGPEAQLILPGNEGPRFPDGAPVIVFIRGGMNSPTLPVSTLPIRFHDNKGAVQLYFDFPQDSRGEQSRHALGAALRFGAGEDIDTDGCTIEDYLGGPLSGQLVVVGYSFGGNIIWSTLADTNVELPRVDGVVSYEVPIVAEMQTKDITHAGYEEGSCTLSRDWELDCTISYDGLNHDQGLNALYIDSDGDGVLGDDEEGFNYLSDPLTSGEYYTPMTTAAAAAASLPTRSDLPQVALERFWRERELVTHIPGAISRFPDLAVMVLGTDDDHGLRDLPDAPHLTGMLAALERAGTRWYRLNPDAAYAFLETGDRDVFDREQPANKSYAIADLPPRMPDATDDGRRLFTAATLELFDRLHDDEWGDDLEYNLY